MLNNLAKLLKYRELIYSLTLREVRIRYKQSILGMFWAILQPLAMMLMFTIVFSKFAKLPSDGIPYPIFSYAALLPWTFFSTSLSFAIPSLVTNMSLVTKIYFPREIFPIASVLAAFVDFGIASTIFLGMTILYKVHLTFNLLFILGILLIQIIFTLGIAFFASAVNVFYRDVKYALPLCIQLWMFASPVVYSVTMVPKRYQTFYMLNPMAVIIDNYRKVILHGIPPDSHYLGLGFAIAVTLFCLSYMYFKRVEMTFADVI